MREDELMHYGIKGQQWGKRRWQYEDGSLTPAGKERYHSRTGYHLAEDKYHSRDKGPTTGKGIWNTNDRIQDAVDRYNSKSALSKGILHVTNEIKKFVGKVGEKATKVFDDIMNDLNTARTKNKKTKELSAKLSKVDSKVRSVMNSVSKNQEKSFKKAVADAKSNAERKKKINNASKKLVEAETKAEKAIKNTTSNIEKSAKDAKNKATSKLTNSSRLIRSYKE